MLKQWLDRNLQAIFARAVEREISRLSGRADKN
jgi:cell pole-organizing protein PopZ